MYKLLMRLLPSKFNTRILEKRIATLFAYLRILQQHADDRIIQKVTMKEFIETKSKTIRVFCKKAVDLRLDHVRISKLEDETLGKLRREYYPLRNSRKYVMYKNDVSFISCFRTTKAIIFILENLNSQDENTKNLIDVLSSFYSDVRRNYHSK